VAGWGAAWPDIIAAAIIQDGFASKFILIFSALFGFGAWQQFQRYGIRPYVQRLLCLAAFGVLNLVLLFEADILLPYAVIGTGLILVRKADVKTLLYPSHRKTRKF
jgi:uncharacterized protein